jgi:hypothetical protein
VHDDAHDLSGHLIDGPRFNFARSELVYEFFAILSFLIIF